MFRISMPLSLIIEDRIEVGFPLLHLGSIVEPVFLEHRDDVIIDDLVQPRIIHALLTAEIAVSQFETGPKRFVLGNGPVEILDLLYKTVKTRAGHRSLVLLEALGPESRMHLVETEPATERIINHGQRPVGRVHHTDDINILGDEELLILVGEGQFLTTVVLLDEHQELAEDLGQIAAVDLVDDEEMRLVRVVGSVDAELVEDASLEFEITS